MVAHQCDHDFVHVRRKAENAVGRGFSLPRHLQDARKVQLQSGLTRHPTRRAIVQSYVRLIYRCRSGRPGDVRLAV